MPSTEGSAAEQTHVQAEAFAEDGTDLTVIRWMLELTPEERLQWLQTHMQGVASLVRDETDS